VILKRLSGILRSAGSWQASALIGTISSGGKREQTLQPRHLVKIVKESGINFSGSLVGMVLNYALLMILTRFLAPEEYGSFVLAQSIINVSLIFVLFGTPKALDRFIPFYNATGEQGKTKTLIYRILKITLILSVIIGLVLFVGSKFLAHSIFKNSQLSLVLKVAVLSMPMLVFIQLVSSAFIGFKELRYRVYIQRLALPLLKIVLAIVVFALGYGLLCWTWMYVLSLVGASILALWFFKKHISSALSKVGKIPISFSGVVSYSWPLSMGSIMLIILSQIDFLFLGYFRTPAEIGIYRIYFYLASALGLIHGSFARIYKPVISEHIAKKEIVEVQEIYKRISKWTVTINVFLTGLFFIFGRSIISGLFTIEYTLYFSGFLILIGGHFVHSAFGPQGVSLEAFGNTRLMLVNIIAMLFVNTVLDVILIPNYGINGAAIATTVALIFVNILAYLEAYVLYRLNPFGLHYAYVVAVLLVASGIVAALKSLVPLTGHIIIEVAVGFGFTLFYVLVVIKGVIDDKDRWIFQRVRAKLVLSQRNYDG